MKNGKCPKCGSEQVYTVQDLPLKAGPFGSNSIPVSLTSLAALDNYVCAQCGFLERYVADAEKLDEIKRKWQRVDQQESDQEKDS